ncbi:RSP_7527 family protein [Lutibaculum baratangense]|uniref:YjiS-like domain-containing protein n=1 Tax=Lutibaculum baratangense AMV1 TaxID=631454 RepID=V4T855_9HYPH|nr:hypothetical protein N177_3915 [Lutibaculum baratangense AMV1]
MSAYRRHDTAIDITRIEAEAHAMRSAVIAQAGANLVRRFTSFVSTIAQTFADARRMDATYRELSLMTDRELRDMGITRADIPAVVAGTYTRPAVEPVAVAPVQTTRPVAENDDLRIAA